MDTDTKLKLITELSQRKPGEVFNNLMHLFNNNSLRKCFYELDGKKAVGADGINKKAYGENVEQNLENLLGRMKQMAYRPGGQYDKC